MELKLQDKAKQILVQIADGSTWRAEQRIDGLYLVEQLTDTSGSPLPEPKPVEEPQPMEAEEGEPTSGEPTQAEVDEVQEMMGDGKTKEQTLEEMFDEQKIEPNHALEDLMKKIPNANGMPDSLKKKVKDPAFRSRLSSIMLDNKYDRKLRGRTRGKLDMGRLHKVPILSRSIFTQKQSRRGKNYNVIVLVDQSGSMGGEKSKQAAEAAMFLLHNFDGININTSIIGFHDSIHIYKDWNSKKGYDEIFGELYETYGGNEDYDAIHFAMEQFKRAPEGENILLMLSDGNPTLDGQERAFNEKGDPVKFTFHKGTDHGQDDDRWDGWKNDKVHLHHLVESYKDVTAIGIGIMQGGWQIPEHFVIQNLDQLKPTIIKTLGRKIKRG